MYPVTALTWVWVSFIQDGPQNCEGGNYSKESYEANQSVSYIVESLDPCSSYSFTVYAENEGGQGQDDDRPEDTKVGGG